jgi:hypothetical protein
MSQPTDPWALAAPKPDAAVTGAKIALASQESKEEA